jgi:hypothetical protein
MLVSFGVAGGMNAPSKRVKITRADFVMAGLVPPAWPEHRVGRAEETLRRGEGPAIHVLLSALKTWMPGTIGERSDAVLRTAMGRAKRRRSSNGYGASEATPFFERLWPGMTALEHAQPG